MEKAKNSLQGKKYNVIRSETAKLGRFEIVLDTVSDNGEHPYSYINQKNSVGILPFYKGKVVLISQYRHAHGRYMIEIPGGGIEENENPDQVAERELLEETGFRCISLKYLGKYCPSPGSSNEVTYLYSAQCANSGLLQREPLEYMDVMTVSEAEMERMIFTGEIEHSMSVIAWMYYRKGKEM